MSNRRHNQPVVIDDVRLDPEIAAALGLMLADRVHNDPNGPWTPQRLIAEIVAEVVIDDLVTHISPSGLN